MTQARDVMIHTVDLSKHYGPTRAVDGINFEVYRKEVVGFLGPNGAGKTTTMKMLTCFLAPTKGDAFIGEHSVWDGSREIREMLGYLPEDTPLYRDMSVLEYLEFIADLRGIERTHRNKKIRHMVELCGLGNMLGRVVGELSKGYRQRVGLAQAMIHDPEVLVLDEPTSGLDPNQIADIRNLIRELGKEKTVILSTHILPEVQVTCGRVVIINQGRLVADGTPQDLQSRLQGTRYHVVVERPDGNAGLEAALKERLGRVTGVKACQIAEAPVAEMAFALDVVGAADVRREVRLAVEAGGGALLELKRDALSLEDVFRKLTITDEHGASANRAEAAAVERAS
ncbi:MAG TPA: ATP-binding cassette domain-containing protein [Polyangia bacterium]|jgi:ABC-2 type transport system ATP-binding protein